MEQLNPFCFFWRLREHAGLFPFEEKRELERAMVCRVWVDRSGNVTIEAALPYLARSDRPDTLKLAKLISVRA
jgi:hypothetical protein